jgi:hypothetical protein
MQKQFRIPQETEHASMMSDAMATYYSTLPLVCMFMTSLIGEVVCAYHHAMTQKNLE